MTKEYVDLEQVLQLIKANSEAIRDQKGSCERLVGVYATSYALGEKKEADLIEASKWNGATASYAEAFRYNEDVWHAVCKLPRKTLEEGSE